MFGIIEKKKKLLVFITTIGVISAWFAQAVPARSAFAIQQDSKISKINLLSSDERGIEIEFSAPNYRIEQVNIQGEGYQKLVVAGTTASMEAGEPQLPVAGVLLGIPAAVDYRLEIIPDHALTLPSIRNLLPASVPAPLDEELTPGETALTVLTGINAGSAQDNLTGYYPNMPARIGGEAWMRDQRVVTVQFYPFQYDRATGQLVWHQNIRARIHFSAGTNFPAGPSGNFGDNPFEQSLQNSLLNYESAKSWRSERGPGTSQVDKPTTSAQVLSGSPGAANPRYRIPVTKDDLYRLTYENLKLAGVPVDPLDLGTLQLSNQGRPVAYFFDDQDGNQVFGAGDSIVFYGQKFRGDWLATRYANANATWLTYSVQLPDGSTSTWKPSMNADMLEKYTDENVYWLDIGGQAGTQMQIINATPTQNNPATSFPEAIHAEQSIFSRVLLFSGEDTWYWDEIKTTSASGVTVTYPLQIDKPASGNSMAKFSGEIVAGTYNASASPDHHIQIFLNDSAHTQPIIDATWDGKSRFHFETDIAQSRLVDGVNQIDLVVYKTANISNEILDLDWFQIDYNRQYIAKDNRLEYTSTNTGDQDYQISGFTTTDVGVYDITDPLIPKKISGFQSGAGAINFRLNQAATARYFAGAASILPVEAIKAYTPVDFTQAADYLLITHRDFISALQPLVNWRTGQGFSVQVIDVDSLYNQFNDGIYNPIAIKNFLAYAFQTWSHPPQFVVLVGDGHYNFKSSPRYDSPQIYMPPFLNWVDPWQGEVDSSNLLATVVGDDPIPDLAIGRMPVNSVQELSNVISKTITYEQGAPQNWKGHILFIADNTPDPAGDFVASAEHIISGYIPTSFRSDRIYLDSFTDSGTCNGVSGDPRTCPAATQAILNYLNLQGALFVNYIGHASLNLWTGEQIVTNQDIPLMTNGARLPIVLSMTCLDGYWMHPNLAYASQSGPALAEELLRADQRGAVATFSPTGLGLTGGHDALMEGFYSAVFQAGAARLADATLAAKLHLYATGYNFDLLHTFTIFGDPALRFPERGIWIPFVNK